MTAEPVSLRELLATQNEMIELVVGRMPNEHRRFLISFEKGEPDWSLLGLPEAANLPAVKWREKNLGGLNETSGVGVTTGRCALSLAQLMEK
jgi:hypothetical protein